MCKYGNMPDITLHIPQSILLGCPGGLLVEYAYLVSPHMPGFNFMLGPLLHVNPSLFCFLPLFQINSQIKVKNAPKSCSYGQKYACICKANHFLGITFPPLFMLWCCMYNGINREDTTSAVHALDETACHVSSLIYSSYLKTENNLVFLNPFSNQQEILNRTF